MIMYGVTSYSFSLIFQCQLPAYSVSIFWYSFCLSAYRHQWDINKRDHRF